MVSPDDVHFKTDICRRSSVGLCHKPLTKLRVHAVFVFSNISYTIKTTLFIFMAQELHDVQAQTSLLWALQESRSLRRWCSLANRCLQRQQTCELHGAPVSPLERP